MSNRFAHIDINNGKIQKIINSAFEVFSNNYWEKASTNLIVKQAGISRGLFYHYFKDKQELFDYLVYFSVKVVISDLDKNIDWEDSDFLNRLRQSLIVALKTFEGYPYLMDFFYKYAGKMDRLSSEHQTDNIAPGMRKKFYSYNLDFSKVRKGVDIIKMMTVSQLVVSGLINEIIKKIKLSGDKVVIDQIMNEVDIYIDFLREQFYK